MKYAVCVLAMVAAVLIAQPAVAQVYSWDGGGSDNLWSNDSNWRNNIEPPMTGAHDISIKASALVSPFQNLANWNYSSTGSCATLEVVANSSYGMTFRKSGSADFQATGRLALTGFSSTRQATLDADADLEVMGLSAYNYVTLDVASGVTVYNPSSFRVDATSAYTECRKVGAGTITCESLVVEPGDSAAAPPEHAYVFLDGGNIAVEGSMKTQIYGSPTIDVEGVVRLQGATFDPGGFQLSGGSNASR